MGTRSRGSRTSRHAAAAVRERIERGGERLWRLDDFGDLSFAAVAQALSRLTRAGAIERIAKGTYYRSRPTTFGQSRPSPSAMRRLASSRRPLFPAGVGAANLLGFSTQVPRRGEMATSRGSLPRKLIGDATLVHTRRPEAWATLPATDAALLDLLRTGGRASELSPEETTRRTLALLAERGRYKRLVAVAGTEPPRVRALLGALGEALGASRASLARLRASLNSLSRFDFGAFGRLPNARAWHAKERRT